MPLYTHEVRLFQTAGSGWEMLINLELIHFSAAGRCVIAWHGSISSGPRRPTIPGASLHIFGQKNPHTPENLRNCLILVVRTVNQMVRILQKKACHVGIKATVASLPSWIKATEIKIEPLGWAWNEAQICSITVQVCPGVLKAIYNMVPISLTASLPKPSGLYEK